MKKENQNPGVAAAVPQEFQTLFRELVVALQPRGPLDRDALRVYYETLSDFPLDVLRDSALTLRRTQTFFPSTGEWCQAAEAAEEDRVWRQQAENQRDACDRCAGRGLIRVNYHSGEPFDIAICNCAAGAFYCKVGETFIRTHLQLAPEHRVADLDAFEADA